MINHIIPNKASKNSNVNITLLKNKGKISSIILRKE